MFNPFREGVPVPHFVSSRSARGRLPCLVLLILAPFLTLKGLSAYGDEPGKAKLDQAIAELDQLDPGWRLKDIEAKRVRPPSGKDSAEVLLAIKDQFSLPTKIEQEALSRATVANPVYRLDGATRQHLMSFVNRNRPLLSALRSLVDRPSGRFILQYDKNCLETKLPHAQPLRDTVRLLQADALLRLDGGDPDGALASCRASICAARSLIDEPIIMSQIVRIACDATTQETIHMILNRGRPSEPALKLAQELVADEVDQPIALMALRGERAGMFETFGHLADGSLTVAEISKSARLSESIQAELVRSSVSLASQAIMLELMTQIVAVVQQPSWTWLDGIETFEESLKTFYDEDQEKKPDEVVPRRLLPGARPLLSGELRTDALGRSLILLIAAKRYAMLKGSLPPSAKALIPKYLKSVPTDPLADKPMLLLRVGDKLTAYSRGVDGRDDGGAIADSTRQSVEKSTDVGFDLSLKNAR